MRLRPLMILAALTAAAGAAAAGSKVDVVLGPNPQPLERLAAEELRGQLERLYQAEVSIAAKPAGAAHLILVGNPETNPAMAAFREQWPKLSDQGHVLRSVAMGGRPVLMIGGGSPAATFWAVAEHGYRLGIRSFAFGDLDPISPPSLHLEGWSVLLEPRLKTRGFTTLNAGDAGLTAWGLADQRKLLRQLAKLKFNQLVIRIEPSHPFLDSPAADAPRSRGFLFADAPLPIDGDSVGRTAFRGLKLFDNPDFAGTTGWKERQRACRELVTGLLARAHELGMSTVASIDPLAFPAEVVDTLHGLRSTDTPPLDHAVPGDPLRPDNPQLLGIARSQLQNLLAECPGADALELVVHPSSGWSQGGDQAWKDLLSRHKTKPPFEYELLTEHMADGELVSLEACSRLVQAASQWTPPGQKPRAVRLATEPRVLDSHMDPFLPPASSQVRVIDLHEISRIPSPPGRRKGCLAEFQLTGVDNLLPAVCLPQLKAQLDALEHYGWDGFVISVQNVGGEIDLPLHLASRASFDAATTARSALGQLVEPICGSGVLESIQKAFDEAELATFPRHPIENASLPAGPLSEAIEKLASARSKALSAVQVRHYTNAMDEMYRANTRSREGGRQFTLYFARRFDFAVEYLTSRGATVDIAGLKDNDARTAAWESIIDGYQRAGTAMAAVARTPSDLAVIAILNRDWYRPAAEALEQLESE